MIRNKFLGLNKGFWWKNPRGGETPAFTIVDQNLTTYTDTGTGVDIVNATQLTITGLSWSIGNRVYKDFGVDYFNNDFEVYFTVRLSYSSNGAGVYFSVFRRENTGGVREALNAGQDFLCIFASPIAGAVTFNIFPYESNAGSALIGATACVCDINTNYYLKVVRSLADNKFTLYVYSDAGRINLIGSSSITLTEQQSFQYFSAVSGHGVYVSSIVNQTNGVVENVKLGLPV